MKDTCKIQVVIMLLISVTVPAGNVPDRLHLATLPNLATLSIPQCLVSTPQNCLRHFRSCIRTRACVWYSNRGGRRWWLYGAESLPGECDRSDGRDYSRQSVTMYSQLIRINVHRGLCYRCRMTTDWTKLVTSLCWNGLSPVSTSRVNGPSWRMTGFHYPSTRLVETRRLSTRPVLTGNGNRSPVNSGR